MSARRKHERGAIIIHVALALLALLAFSAFVVDYGAMWVSRRQAQNAADAGALAGAIALMKDGGTRAEAAKSALQWASDNAILASGELRCERAHHVLWPCRNVRPSCDVASIPPCGNEPGAFVSTSFGIRRIAVSRRRTLGTPIPTFFGPHRSGSTAAGRASHGDRAGRVREHGPVHAALCRRRPLGGSTTRTSTTRLCQRWRPPPWRTPSAVGRRMTSIRTQLVAAHWMSYTPPYHSGHTGWTVAGDYGRQLDAQGWRRRAVLRRLVATGRPAGQHRWQRLQRRHQRAAIRRRSALLRGRDLRTAIRRAAPTMAKPRAGCLGVNDGLSAGPTDQGVEDTRRRRCDSASSSAGLWRTLELGCDAGRRDRRVVSSTASGALNMSSPRIRPVAVFDITDYMTYAGCKNQSGTGCVVQSGEHHRLLRRGHVRHRRDARPARSGRELRPGSRTVSEERGRRAHRDAARGSYARLRRSPRRRVVSSRFFGLVR